MVSLLTRQGLIRSVCPLSLLVLCSAAHAQSLEGELHLTVLDPSGRSVAAEVSVSGRNPVFEVRQRASPAGTARFLRIPQGVYEVTVRHPGFEATSRAVEIRSAVPQRIDITLKLGGAAVSLTVGESAPLMDPQQPHQILHVGRTALDLTTTSLPGRSLIEAVTLLPGWLVEANAVLHPRGSEYDTQYVIDGIALYDNRSLAFAPPFESEAFEAVHVMTSGIPAEYGRRLGGVISADTRHTAYLGHSGEGYIQGGAYGTMMGSGMHQYRGEKTLFSLGLRGAGTDRYLDPPSLENFTNTGTTAGAEARMEQDLGGKDRLSFLLRGGRNRFLVPNTPEQQEAEQRQDRTSAETAGQVHWQHTFNSSTMSSIRGMARDLSARLWSNPLSTPVLIDQDRGFREGIAIGSLTVERERHTLKFGGDFRTMNVRERFLVTEPDEPGDPDVNFRLQRRSTESSAFVQDHLRLGNFAASVGLRFDSYRFLVNEHAFSPRVALSYYIPRADLQLRASYDRVFQTPPVENLLLSSFATGLDLEGVEGALPLKGSRGHFFEVGFRKPLGRLLRLDGAHYWRTFRNYLDDDVFFNTGISIPITFDTARVQGTEVRLEMPQWRGISAFASWSNMLGRASSPVTGGLFLDDSEAERLRDRVERFPITQDQRNTVASQVRWQPVRRAWLMGGVRYGSGLPVELDDEDEDEGDDEGEIPEAIREKVNFERGRLKPNCNLDFGAGIRLIEQDNMRLTLSADVRNATDRLNVINFSGLFSGTAIAPGRQFTLQLRARW